MDEKLRITLLEQGKRAKSFPPSGYRFHDGKNRPFMPWPMPLWRVKMKLSPPMLSTWSKGVPLGLLLPCWKGSPWMKKGD